MESRSCCVRSSRREKPQGALQMRFENQIFTTDVTLDYNQFIGGVIKNCVVFYYGGGFSLSETRIEKVRFAMAGAPKRAFMFFRVASPRHPPAVCGFVWERPSPPKWT